MKKNLFVIGSAVLSCLALLAPTAHATLIAYEPFAYANGDLGQALTNNVWSRTGTGDSIQVVNGNLEYPDYGTSTGGQVQWGGDGRISRMDFAAVTSGSIYVSLLYRMETLGTLSTTGGALAGLVNAANTANPNSRVYLRRDLNNSAAFNFGVLEKNSAVAWSSIPMTVNTTYLVVFSLDFKPGVDDDTARLWINPSPATFGAAQPPTATLTATGGPDATQVNRFRLIQNPTGGSATSQYVDEIRIGTSWSDVVVAAPIPEPSAVIMSLTGVLFLLPKRRR